jgi:spore maturation protein A
MDELSKLADDRRQGRLPGPARKKGIASNEMCTFLIINISSLQLIPINVIAYQSQYGSVNPAAIVEPGIAATAVSTAVAVVYCKLED